MSDSPVDILFVPGFLGLPSDGDPIAHHLQEMHSINFRSMSAMTLAQDEKDISLESLGAKISHEVTENTVTIGYSLGGRVLMHLLPEALRRVRAIVLISSHFGLSDDEEKSMRLRADIVWGERFLTEDWTTLMAAWEAQPIFANDRGRVPRLEKNYDRNVLDQVLVQCSLGVQRRNIHSEFPFEKTLYVHGAQDSKYLELAQKWRTQQPLLTVKSVESGHFPLVNSARVIAADISRFYRNLMNS